MASSARMAMTKRVHPLASLNPYQGNCTIKVRVTSKGNVRSYRNARGEGNFFNIELTYENGTQIQAKMFNEAVRKFFNKFQVGKLYYIQKGNSFQEALMATIGVRLSPSLNSGGRSIYSARVPISHIISNPSLDEEKVGQLVFFVSKHITRMRTEEVSSGLSDCDPSLTTIMPAS